MKDCEEPAYFSERSMDDCELNGSKQQQFDRVVENENEFVSKSDRLIAQAIPF